MEARSWAPSDLRTSRCREDKLMQRMKVFIKELGNSRFYGHFLHLLRTSSVSEHLRKVLGAHSKMQMVAYGIGSFELSNQSALQLSLAILMQRDLRWIGFLQVFDPIFSTVECRVLEALGCSVINFDEDGMKRALEPTLFYMPYCPWTLSHNLMLVNWNPDLLSNVVIFGTSFLKHLKFTDEFIMENRNPRISFIKDISWIFFNVEHQYKNTPHYDRFYFSEKRETDLQVYSWTKIRLEEKIENFINNLESSQVYHNLQDKLQTPLVSQHLDKMMMRSKSKMKIVVCDIGSIESSEFSRSHLSLVIFMKKHFEWIGDIQVYERFLSATECQVLKYFGCKVLSFDEYRRSWQARKPTIFFMPRYSTALHDKLLEANWKSDLLSNIILFGNSISEYRRDKFSHMDFEHSMRYREAIESFTKNVMIKTLPDGICTRTLLQESDEWDEDFLISLYFAFDRSITWQFFSHVTEAELQFMNYFLQKGCHISLLG